MTRRKMKPPSVHNTLPPKLMLNLARGAVAGLFTQTLGAASTDVEAAATGVSRGWLREVVVVGLDGTGSIRDEATLTFPEDNNGEIAGIALDDPNRSVLEMLDGGFAKVVAFQAERMRKKNLTVRVFYAYHDSIARDPERLAECRRILGTAQTTAPEWAPGYAPKICIRVTPSKDRNMSLTVTHGLKRMR